MVSDRFALSTVTAFQLNQTYTNKKNANDTGIVSAPLWDSKSSTFAGLLTTSDYINIIQYYFQNPAALDKIDQFRLANLRGTISLKAVEAETLTRL